MDIVDRLHGDALTHRLTDDAITEIERLRSTVAALEAERDQLRDVLWRGGFVMCDIPACNCGSWHHKYGLPERFREIADVLAEAGHELCNENGNLPIRALKSLAAERDQLRAELAECRRQSVRLYNSGYHAGHHDTVEGQYTHILPCDIDTYHDDIVAELAAREE